MVEAPHRALRYRCELETTLVLPSGEPAQGRLLELSLTGAFVETEVDLQVDDRVRLTVPVPGGAPWVVETTVVRLGRKPLELSHPRVANVTVSRYGVAVAFDRVPEEIAPRLARYLEQLDEQ